MFVATSKTSVTELIIQAKGSRSSTAAILQKFPLTVSPRVGEKLSVAGLNGVFSIVEVEHTFTHDPARHVVLVTVEQST